MKKLYILGFALMVLFSITMNAEALESKTVFLQNGMFANAEWWSMTNDVITITDLYVTQTKEGTYIGLSICDEYGISCKGGLMLTQKDVFSIDKKLISASLSEVEMNVTNWATSTTETLKVKADWTGMGNITKDSSKSKSITGPIMKMNINSYISRMSTATGSIDGNNLGDASSAGMNQFKSIFVEIIRK